MELGLPNYKKVPNTLVVAARAERARRKACHGDWTPCKTTEKKDN